MEERSIGVGALALDVPEEIAAQLPGTGSADDGREFNGLAGSKRQLAIENRRSSILNDSAFRARIFKSEEERACHDWGTAHRAHDVCVRDRDVDHLYLDDGKVLPSCGDGEQLADVAGAVPQHDRP